MREQLAAAQPQDSIALAFGQLDAPSNTVPLIR